MKIETGFDYPGASIDAVFAMLTDAEFQRQRCAATGARESTVDVSGDLGAPTVACRRVMPTDSVPDFVRRIVGSSIEIVDELHWQPPDRGPGSGLDSGPDRRADVVLSFGNQPARMKGVLYVHNDEVGTHGRLSAELKAAIPLLGGRIEKAIAPLILRAMASEESVGRRWLSR